MTEKQDKTYNLGFKAILNRVDCSERASISDGFRQVDNPAPSLVKNKDQLMEIYKDIISRHGAHCRATLCSSSGCSCLSDIRSCR